MSLHTARSRPAKKYAPGCLDIQAVGGVLLYRWARPQTRTEANGDVSSIPSLSPFRARHLPSP